MNKAAVLPIGIVLQDCGGTLSDLDCMRMIGIARNTYYRYKAQLKNEA